MTRDRSRIGDVLEMIRELGDGPVDAASLADRLGAEVRPTRNTLTALIDAGLPLDTVQHRPGKGTAGGAPVTTYRLTEAALRRWFRRQI